MNQQKKAMPWQLLLQFVQALAPVATALLQRVRRPKEPQQPLSPDNGQPNI